MDDRPSVLLLVLGVAVAVLVGGAGIALLPPPPPEHLPWPEASALRELNPYLSPAKGTPRGASTAGTVVASDPFGESGSAGPVVEPSAPAWRLTAIVISGDRRMAVVNGQLVKPGESVDGGRVRAIQGDQVVIERPDGSQSTLRLQSGEGE